MRHHVADFAVLAFADRKHQPDIGALVAPPASRRSTPYLMPSTSTPFFSSSSWPCVTIAMGANAIASQPAGVGQFERARQSAVIGEQQQAFGVEIEPADRDQPRQSFRQVVEHGRPSLGIGMRGHQAARLVEHEQPRALARRQRLAVDRNHIVAGDVERRRVDDAAVDGDAALRDPFLGIAARSEASPRHHLGNALAGLLLWLGARRPLVEVGRALAIGAAAAERRTFCKNPAVVLVVAARPIFTGFVARMFLPIGAALGPPRVAIAIPTRPVEFRTVTAILTGPIEFRPFTERAVSLGTILALLPRL